MNPEDQHSEWRGYELLATGDGERLEKWNGIHIRRPESAAIWPWHKGMSLPSWDGFYSGIRATGGEWLWKTPLPDPCIVEFGSLSFLVKPTNSKHLGLFPEQAANWLWIQEVIRGSATKKVNVLNLFGYTGAATIAAASAGASVTHVDSARAMVSWCSENARLSGLGDAPIRYIVEDSLTFLQRENRRGRRYDGVIMDPPTFGRGKGGELWKITEHLPFLIDRAQEVLSDEPLFLLLNTYSDSIDDLATSSICKRMTRLGGCTEIVDLGLVGTLDGQRLPCGITYRWSEPKGETPMQSTQKKS